MAEPTTTVTTRGYSKKRQPEEATGVACDPSKKVSMKTSSTLKHIQGRVENSIKRDAAKELLKIRATTSGGKAKKGDVDTVVEMYNSLGYSYISNRVVLYHAGILERKQNRRYRQKNEKDTDDNADDDDSNVSDEENDMVIDLSDVSPKVALKPTKKSPNSKKNSSNIKSGGLFENPIRLESATSSQKDNDRDDNKIQSGLSEDMTILIANGAPALEWNEDTDEENPAPVVRKKGGRPVGAITTSRRKKDKKVSPSDPEVLSVKSSKLIQELTSTAAELFLVERIKARNENRPVQNGTLKKILTKLEMEAGIPPRTLNSQTVLGRVSRNNLTGKALQRTPILEQLEPDVIKYCVQIAKMSQALTKEQVTNVTQTLVRRNNLESYLLDLKRKRKWVSPTVDEPNDEAVGVGSRWFRGFMERHQQEIVRQVGHELRYVSRFFNLRLEHFKVMYDIMYENMVRAGVAEKFQRPVLFDVDGKRVPTTDRELAYGLPTKYRITKPEYVLYVDQLGYTDKSVHEPGNFYNHVDGQLFSLPTDGGLGEVNDMKFSIYCFCDGMGDAVLCAIILLSEKDIDSIPYSIRYGIDVCKPLQAGQTELELYERNCGPGKAMQGGPECHYVGKVIPSFVGTSSTGRLTSDLLHSICKYLDSYQLYDRSNGTKPLLLLDGHGGIFETPFLDYIQEPVHEWVVSCGLHHDSHILQLASSHEFNTSFKEEFGSAKERLLSARIPGQRRFYPSDVIPLIKNAWLDSFGLPKSCKKGIALRGWNPLNYALLLHPGLNKKEHMSERKTQISGSS